MLVAERELQNRNVYRERQSPYQHPRRQPGRERRPQHKGMYIVKLILVALTAFFLVSQYSAITASQYRIEKLKANLKNTEAQNERLKVEIANLKSVARIEDIARNKLNMMEPENHQIIYINRD